MRSAPQSGSGAPDAVVANHPTSDRRLHTVAGSPEDHGTAQETGRVVGVLRRVGHEDLDLGRKHGRREDARVDGHLPSEVVKGVEEPRLVGDQLDAPPRGDQKPHVRVTLPPLQQRRQRPEFLQREVRRTEHDHVQALTLGGGELVTGDP